MVTIKTYGGYNLKELQFLGKGTQGSVYRIDRDRCIKVFKSKSVCRDEHLTLMMAQGDTHFPRLYRAGEKYIVRECVNGIELNKYLLEYPLNPMICNEIINIYEAMVRIGYNRLDSAIFHIFVTLQGTLKVIDTSKAIKKKAKYPRKILEGLRKLGCEEKFLRYVKHARPDIYTTWKNKGRLPQ